MTFEGQYLTYREYKSLIEGEGGSAMAEMPFNILEFEARRQIDIRTFDRLKDSENIPQEVKLCEYALINSIKIYNESSNNTGNIASENTDGYSISYVTTDKVSDIVKSKQNEIEEIIRTYLVGVIFNDEHLMYCGV